MRLNARQHFISPAERPLGYGGATLLRERNVWHAPLGMPHVPPLQSVG